MKILKPRSASDTRLTLHGLAEERRLAVLEEKCIRASEAARRAGMTRSRHGDTRRPEGGRP